MRIKPDPEGAFSPTGEMSSTPAHTHTHTHTYTHTIFTVTSSPCQGYKNTEEDLGASFAEWEVVELTFKEGETWKAREQIKAY